MESPRAAATRVSRAEAHFICSDGFGSNAVCPGNVGMRRIASFPDHHLRRRRNFRPDASDPLCPSAGRAIVPKVFEKGYAGSAARGISSISVVMDGSPCTNGKMKIPTPSCGLGVISDGNRHSPSAVGRHPGDFGVASTQVSQSDPSHHSCFRLAPMFVGRHQLYAITQNAQGSTSSYDTPSATGRTRATPAHPCAPGPTPRRHRVGLILTTGAPPS